MFKLLMFNFIDRIKENPIYYKQLSINEQLVTLFTCPIEQQKANVWSHKSYFVYVIEGRKTWHTNNSSFELTQGQCAFIKKGAHIIEQFNDSKFCVVFFFISDDFIIDTIKDIIPLFPHSPLTETEKDHAIIRVATNDLLHSFFNSVIPYFLNEQPSNTALLELKFKELILNVVTNTQNHLIRDYFKSLATQNSQAMLVQIMEENFLNTLKLEDYARMCNKSLSSFKRDFFKHFQSTPGKWIIQKRALHSISLLKTTDKTISEIAYECGFENTSHFSKVFKQTFKISPTQFRNSNT